MNGLGSNGRWYHISPGAVPKAERVSYCEGIGMELARVDNKADFEGIAGFQGKFLFFIFLKVKTF